MHTHANPMLTWNEWVEILTRNFDLDVEKLHRREYRRYDVDDGLVNIVFLTAPERHPLPDRTILTLLDVSPTGFMARGFIEYARETTAEVELIFGDVQRCARARIMHSTLTLGGFKVGFELIFDDGPPKE